MLSTRRSIALMVIATVLLALLSNGAQAADPIRRYQIDVVPISNTGEATDVTEEVSRQIIAQVDSAYNDATGGLIRFVFRKLHPVVYPVIPTLHPIQILGAPGITPVPDKGFDGAILVGVIEESSAMEFAGQASGKYILMNGNWSLNSRGPAVLAHELGHTPLGLEHANSAVCTTKLPIICEQRAYGDFSSTMGSYVNRYVSNPMIARFSATELDKLKVLPRENKAIAAESGEYKLAPVYSKGSDLPKVLYIPIGGRLAYSVEYRPNVGDDLSLSFTEINIPGTGSYYPNTPSHGLQLRILNSKEIVEPQFEELQPTFSNYENRDTALVIPSFSDDQVWPVGKVFNLSDGSTLTYLSSDPDSGASVRVQRPLDSEPPRVSEPTPRLLYKEWIGSFEGDGNIFKNAFNQWEYPAVEIPLNTITDNRSIKTIQIEVNGQIIGKVDQPLLNGIKVYTFQTIKPGTFSVRLIGTDYAGLNKTSTTVSITTSHFQISKPSIQIDSQKDPMTSFNLLVYPNSEDIKYSLLNLSSGNVASIAPKGNALEYKITNIARNQVFTASLSGTDDSGYSDGGSPITYTPETTECTNSQCFVGYQWNVETGSWPQGVGNLILQKRIGSKWVNIRTAKPVPDPKGIMNKNVTFIMKVEYQTPGKHTYRLSLAASKKYMAMVLPTFNQKVSAP